ncbi:MAG: aminotransferase class III-fold pyridoxal phosphate-dependent enzyme, partial [Pseudomonadota bacterium]
VQGAGGVIVPPETYWPEIQKICDAHEILLIADEVITGFGRTGNMFATQTFDIRPDIIAIAKGLSSGYAPIGGSVVREDVARVLNDAGEFFHGYTYSGHPVACAVALENIRLLEEEGVVNTVRTETSPHFSRGWETLGDHPLVGQTAHKGLMASITLTPNKATRADFGDRAGEIGMICRDHAARFGLVMRAVGDRMIVAPPLTIKTHEIDLLLQRAKAALDATLKELPTHGIAVA